jgi:hypothetical protein
VDIRRAVGVAGLALLFLACEREEKMVREDLPMAATSRARADVQALAAAVNAYRATCGRLPETLIELTIQKMVEGAPCGPFLGSVPNPPRGWTAYNYLGRSDEFSVSTTDGTQTVSAP